MLLSKRKHGSAVVTCVKLEKQKPFSRGGLVFHFESFSKVIGRKFSTKQIMKIITIDNTLHVENFKLISSADPFYVCVYFCIYVKRKRIWDASLRHHQKIVMTFTLFSFLTNSIFIEMFARISTPLSNTIWNRNVRRQTWKGGMSVKQNCNHDGVFPSTVVYIQAIASSDCVQ